MRPEYSDLAQLLLARAAGSPEQTVFTFLADEKKGQASWTYGELERRARAIAAELQSQDCFGQRVVLLYPSGLEFIAAFWGCLLAGAIAVPAYPPRSNRNLFRLMAIAKDCRARAALTTRQIQERMGAFAADASLFKAIRLIPTDDLPLQAAEAWKRPNLSGDSIALLQYTSGSTGTPKGVMVSHANLLHNEALIQSAFRQSRESVIVGWLPLYHDMGLIGNVLQPIYCGARCILMSPISFLQSPVRWLNAISQYRATTSGGPNFSYDLCVRKVSPAEEEQLDLSSWTVAFNGAEPVRSETMQRFARRFEKAGFRPEAFAPCYGLAEATLFVSGHVGETVRALKVDVKALAAHEVRRRLKKKDGVAHTLTSSGRIAPGVKVRIVDPESGIGCSEHQVGEVWVSGPSVAQGYWGRTEESERIFGARIVRSSQGPFLRTGDLGFLQRGELFVTGRLKDLIIIRGRNLYPQDIEASVERAHPGLRAGCGAAFAVEVEGEERVVVVQEVERGHENNTATMVDVIRHAIAEQHEVQPFAIFLTRAGSIPKTSSGKIQRYACRDLYQSGKLDPLAEWHGRLFQGESASVVSRPATPEALEQWLIRRTAAGMNVAPEEIKPDTSLARCRMDSLAVVELAHAIEREWNVAVPVSTLFQEISIRELAGQLLQAAPPAPVGIAGEEFPEAYASSAGNEFALTEGQKALWFLHQLDPSSTAYNLSFAARTVAPLNVPVLQAVFQTLAERHESLRTTFHSVDGVPVQRVHGSSTVSIREVEARNWSEAALQARLDEEANFHFHLEQGPLLRVALYRRSSGHVIGLTAHHIISDLWSLALLIREMAWLYAAGVQGRTAFLPTPAFHYRDYVRWQQQMLAGEEGARLRAYWQTQLAGELSALNLPLDRQRPALQTHRGASMAFRLDKELSQEIRRFSGGKSATVYTTLMAAFQALLHRYSSQEDILVGSPAAAKSRAEWAGIFGYFVNTLVLRGHVRGDLPFSEFLQRVKRTVNSALENQDYPFFSLVEELQPVRDPSRSPLFQAMFTFEKTLQEEGISAFALGEPGASAEFSGLVLESVAIQNKASLFDLQFTMAELEDVLCGSIRYNLDLFESGTIERMAGHWAELLRGAVTHPETLIGELPLLTAAERRQVIEDWNSTAAAWGQWRPVHVLFEQQAARTPHACAVSDAGLEVTYAELNARANQWAHYLTNAGVDLESHVAICMERSAALVTGLLAILKAGAAYVPLDPEYPVERLAFMIRDVQPRVILVHQKTAEKLPTVGAKIINVDADRAQMEQQSRETRESSISPSNLAYVIYTSGSTGQPKGAMNTHGGLYNRLQWMQNAYRLTSDDRVLQKTPFSFDVSVWEFFWPLITGAVLVVAEPGGHRDPEYLGKIIEQACVTTLHFVPSMLRAFLDADPARKCGSVRRVICSGEALSPETARLCLEKIPADLYNLYGPTEVSIDVTSWKCEPGNMEKGVALGRPIANTQVYVLSESMDPAPVGVPGELYLGGDGLARGYLKRPELTAEKFVPNPWSARAGERLYRTGDLVKWRSDGNLDFLHRIDHQVKIHGNRVELGEVEAALNLQESVAQAVVIARDDEHGDKRLVAYVQPKAGMAPDAGDLRRQLKQLLPEYMVPAAVVFLERMPLNANGKIDRKALPEVQVNLERQDYVRPTTAVEEILCGIWSEVLGLDRIGVEDNFFELGGHSLKATQVVARVRTGLDVELPLSAIFEAPTVVALAPLIAETGRSRAESIVPLERAGRGSQLPLSYAQQRLWFIHQMEPEQISYNLPGAAKISGPLDVSALTKAFVEIARRHDSLRTRFISVDGEPQQVIDPKVHLELPVIDLSGLAEAAAAQQLKELEWQAASTPFELEQAPLLRLKLVRLSAENHVLLVTMHHIISDGWSFNVLLGELKVHYEAYLQGQEPHLPELPVQYGDYALGQRKWLDSSRLEEQLGYWSKQLADAPATQDIPGDHPRPALQSNSGARNLVHIEKELLERLRKTCRQQSVTLYMALLAALQTLIYRYTGQTDIVVGAGIAGRRQAETEKLIGFFVNTLPMRTGLDAGLTFVQLLKKVKKTALEAYANQDVPFEKLVETLAPGRDMGRTPFFQVVFGFQDEQLPETRIGEARLQMSPLENYTSKFDLTLLLEQSESGLNGFLEYCTDLFDPATIARMIGHFNNLLAAVAEDPNRRISTLPMLSETEKRQLLDQWSGTEVEIPPRCVHELLEEQARRTPDATAVVFEGRRLSYAEFNRQANRIGHYLRKLGVGPEMRVGICMERSFEALAGLAGILKAGGAYVPLDPDYPLDRLHYMIGDAGIQLLVTQKRLIERFPGFTGNVVSLDVDWPLIAKEDSTAPVYACVPENLAYVIYTSGSTGMPKGVSVHHAGIVRLVKNTGYIDFSIARSFLQFAPTSFDASTFEIWGALLNGAQLTILPPGIPALSELARFIQVNAIDMLWITTPLFHQLMETEPDSVKAVKQIITGGEVLSPQIAAKTVAQGNSFLNCYGPTENTTFSTYYLVRVPEDVGEEPVPIGISIANTQAYVLDQEMQLVPAGVAGELFLGGAGLARGYLDRPALTAEKFVPHPFSRHVGQRLYRTGDMVRWRADGNLDFIGRMDRQIKIRGFRVELGEIEEALKQYAGVKEAVVLAQKEETGLRLVAYVAAGAETGITQEQLADHLRLRLPEYMVPAGWLLMEQLPHNANGKIDRAVLASLKLDATRPRRHGEAQRPPTQVEEILCNIWEQVLKVPSVDVEDNFFDLGGHSLLATQIMSRVEQVFSVHMPLRSLFESPLVKDMAQRIEQKRGHVDTLPEAPFHVMDRTLPLQLSYAQQRLWFIDQLEQGSASYNISGALQIEGPLNVEVVKRTFRAIVRRHESLRTRFAVVRGEPRQVIEKDLQVDLPIADLSAVPGAERENAVRQMVRAEVEQVFDLRQAPLLRVKLLRLAEELHLLVVIMHHIICDGWSLGILTREFGEIYQAFSAEQEPVLPPLEVQYGDFAVWQREWMQGEVLEQQMGFWKKQLSGAAALDLPRDYPRPPIMSHRGGSLEFVLSKDLTARLKQVSRQECASLFMTLLTGFNVMLAAYSGVEDVSVGTPIANRNRIETENLIGNFVNTLVLRTDVSGNPTWRELLARTRQVTLEAYQYQDVPFEKLVEELQPERDLSRSPFFQNLLVLQNMDFQELHLSGLTIRDAHPDRWIAKYDLIVDLTETESGLKGCIDYALDLFEERTIRHFAGYLRAVLEAFAANPAQRIGHLNLLTESERSQVLSGWNQTEVSIPGLCVHELFAGEAERNPNAIALEQDDRKLTYGELNRKANQLARYLQGLGVGPETRVAICMDRSFAMVIGLLGILKASAAYVPLDPAYPMERLSYMLETSHAPVLLTERNYVDKLPSGWAYVVSMDESWPEIERESPKNPVMQSSPHSLAYVIYTSGSTGAPKGVEVEHRSIVRLVKQSNYVEIGTGDRFLQFAPVSFDASTFEIWACLLNGACLLLFPPGTPSIEELVQFVEQKSVTVMWLTAGLFHQVVDLECYRLAGVRKLLAGGDVLSTVHVRKLLEQAPQTHLINGYGPTENTTFSCCYRMARGQAYQIIDSVPIGSPITNTRAYVLDANYQPVPVRALGELYVGGLGLARGYADRPDLTAEKFVPDPHSGIAGERLYRAGDLVRWRWDGTLEFAGRRDNQVKVRGYRIELAEIEKALMESADVLQTVVVARGEHAEDKRLVAYVVPQAGKSVEAGKLADYLRRRLPAYMVPAHFVELGELPITANGKVDRNRLPAPTAETADSYVAPQTAQEEVLCGIVAEVLEQPRVGVDDNFFDLGGHSLLATLVVSRVRAMFGVELPLQALFEQPTVRGMVERLKEELAAMQQSDVATAIPRIPRDGSPLLLSYAQQRLWFIDQMEPNSALYNIPLAGKVSGSLDKRALQKSLNEIVRRHEVLRTRFSVRDGGPVQEIVPDQQVVVEEIDLRSLSEMEREVEAMALAETETAIGFDLAKGPLLRMKLLQMSESDYVLLMTIHHIISDGWSFSNFFNELGRLYESYRKGEESPLQELEIQYADFAAWQREWLQGKTMDEQLAYWVRQLDGLPVLDLATDYSRPAIPRHRGATFRFEISTELTARLKELSSRQEATLFMTSLAAFYVLLFRYSGQSDLAVGSPIANRNRKEIEKLIGFFVNTLVLRADLGQRPGFTQVLDRVKKTTLDAYANQDLPFEKLVEVLSPERDISRSPLFQVVFAMQGAPLAEVPLGDLSLQLFNVNSSTAKFDLILGVVEDHDGFKASLEYNTDLFEPATAERMAQHFQTLLESIVTEPERPVQTLPLLSAREQEELAAWNRTDAGWPRDICLPDLFEEQVRCLPNAVAVEFQDRQLTYQELDRRANQLGNRLQKLGVGPEVRVGICLERNLDLIVSLMAVEKAGGAYVPLDPDYPAERVSYMLKDSQASVLVTQTALLDHLPPFEGALVDLEGQAAAIGRENVTAPKRKCLPENLAYVIYTSGSTGQPKGVAIRHSSVVAFICWCRETFSPEELSGVLASTSICFDVSIFETFGPLSCGGRLVLVRNVLDVERIENGERLKVISTVPSAMRELVSMKAIPDSVITVNLGGEAVPVGLAAQIYESTRVERVLNMYGPTEDTTYSTCAWLPREPEQTVPIGRPISNSKVYVLDAEMQQAPVGVTGDIYISGAGLARGYLTHPEWTAEKFIPNPFSDAPGDRLYRVGDLGTYRPDGQLGYLGRNDFQVKIRGHRIELGEIEAALEEMEGITQAVVMAREDGEKQLVAYLVNSGDTGNVNAGNDEIREHLRRRLPDYMCPAAFVRMESLPLTPNGKINRRALPAPAIGLHAIDGAYAAPDSPLEELLSDIWAQVLRVETIGVNDDFFARGGHSLLATQVVARMRSALNVNVPLPRIFETPTIAELAKFIEQQLQGTTEKTAAITRAPRHEPLVLSYTQRRLWFIDQLEPDGTSYNLPAAVQIEGPLEVAALEKSLNEIVRRHEVLRTRFVVVDGEPRQVIDEHLTLKLTVVDFESMTEKEHREQVERFIEEDAQKAFNLASGPLVRVSLLRLSGERYILVVVMHHIVADDWSHGVLSRELTVLYRSFSAGQPSPLAELPIQYADFSVWQQRWLNGGALAQQLDYWKTQLSGLQALDLPTDHPRPTVRKGRGGRINFTVSAELAKQLKKIGRSENVTLYMTLLAAYQTTLFHYSGQTDIAVGTSVAGRRQTEVESLIGCFINMLVLRTDLSQEPSFAELLSRVKNVALGAYAHQDVPFEKLVETLQPERDLSRSPLFQVMLVLHNTPQSELQLGDARLRMLDIESRSTKFDLTLFVSEDAGGLKCVLYYDTDLFDVETITRLAQDFQTILNIMASSPEKRITEISLTSEDEQRQLLSAWNEPGDSWQEEKNLPHVATAGD
jgi:amino acid adenylation domain-containing protein